MKVTLLMTTINELEGMKAIMPKVDRNWVDQIIVSDYLSTDGTVEWAKEQNYFVVNQQKPGLRRAFIEALPYVEGDIVVMFSPDGNSVAERIPDLINKMKEGYDMVIASSTAFRKSRYYARARLLPFDYTQGKLASLLAMT